jgi:hypothetical protein
VFNPSEDVEIKVFRNRTLPSNEHYESLFLKFLEDVKNTKIIKKSGKILVVSNDESNLPMNLIKYLRTIGVIFSPHSYPKIEGDNNCPSHDTLAYIPDPHFILHDGFEKLIQSFPNQPWMDRNPKVFWRGTTTGFDAPECFDLMRVKVCKKAAATNMPWLDIKISGAEQTCRDKKAELSKINVTGAYANENDWVKNRGILDIDGNSHAWGLVWRLLSGSTVFRVETNFCNYLSQFLVPGIHYVSISRDLSNLEKKTKQISSHESSVLKYLKRVAESASKLRKLIRYQQIVERYAKTLESFFL